MLVSYILCHRQSCKHVDLTCSSASRKLHCSSAKFFLLFFLFRFSSCNIAAAAAAAVVPFSFDSNLCIYLTIVGLCRVEGT